MCTKDRTLIVKSSFSPNWSSFRNKKKKKKKKKRPVAVLATSLGPRNLEEGLSGRAGKKPASEKKRKTSTCGSFLSKGVFAEKAWGEALEDAKKKNDVYLPHDKKELEGSEPEGPERKADREGELGGTECVFAEKLRVGGRLVH